MTSTTPSHVVRPPIPAQLAHRPTLGGLVVPWINVTLADGGADFRSPHRARVDRCWMERLCQTCGERLGARCVLFGGPRQIAPGGYFDEPPMHPACAVYARQACPMVAGRLATYAAGPRLSEGRRGAVCPEPGCDCGGWVLTDGTNRGGEPAHPYWEVWADPSLIVLAVTPEGRLLGGAVPHPVRVRLIETPVSRAAGVT